MLYRLTQLILLLFRMQWPAGKWFSLDQAKHHLFELCCIEKKYAIEHRPINYE